MEKEIIYKGIEELSKLEAYLERKGVGYERIARGGIFWKYQIVVYDHGQRAWDAIYSYGSYGYEEGLLEVMGEPIVKTSDGGVCGWLTADDIIKRLEAETEQEMDKPWALNALNALNELKEAVALAKSIDDAYADCITVESLQTAIAALEKQMLPNDVQDIHAREEMAQEAEMKDRLDEVIGQTAYILDCLRVLKEIMDSGSCNDCDNSCSCKYSPGIGEQVRYNCPFYMNSLKSMGEECEGAERNKGRWIKWGAEVKCSHCDLCNPVEKPFCPNCGADMRGEMND